jgi:DNA polymerase-3 subunit beta
MKRAIVPTKGLLLFSRVMQDPLSRVELQFTENQLAIRATLLRQPEKSGSSEAPLPDPIVTAEIEAFARLIEGEFPKYATVIPNSAENILEADTETFTRKLRLVTNVTSADLRAVKLSLSKGEMEIKARSPTRGEASARMKVDFKGKSTDIAFNPDFVLEGLKNSEQSLVRLEFRERTSPGKFNLGENYYYVVMPITAES